MSSLHLQKGTGTYATYSLASLFSTRPSRISTRRGWPQSRQGKSTVTSFPGNSQLTASDSKPHWPNQVWRPSMVIRYWVGRLLKGANDTMRSVRGYSQPAMPEENRS